MKPSCRMCGKRTGKPAKPIESAYEYAVQEPTFCTIRCAADYGLIQAQFNMEYWCDDCGEWTTDCDHVDEEEI